MALSAWCFAIAFTAWVIASLLGHCVTAAPVAAGFSIEVDPRAAAQQIVARSPMTTGAMTAVALGLPAASSSHKLVGVATGFGNNTGFALLRHNNGPVMPAVAGETLAPGIRLLRLHADSVEIDYGGRIETVRLIRERAAPPPAAPARVAQPAQLR